MQNKIFIFAAVFMMLVEAQAVTLEVIGKKGTSLLRSEEEYALPSNVGQISVQSFNKAKIEFTGGTYGISKMFNLGSDLEIISNSEMKAYGWCFSLNDETPEKYADEMTVQNQTDKIIWYYAFAHYKEGVWLSQCEKDQ